MVPADVKNKKLKVEPENLPSRPMKSSSQNFTGLCQTKVLKCLDEKAVKSFNEASQKGNQV